MNKISSAPLFTVFSLTSICHFQALRPLKSLKSLVATHTLLELLITAVFLAACSNQNATSSMPTPDVFFPKQKETEGERAVMDALLTGDLVEANGCLRVNASESGNSYLLIWPPDFSRTTENGMIQVRDGSGQVVVQVGDKVRISGGEVPTEAAQEFSDQPLPHDCPEPYWIVGDEISRIETLDGSE